MTIDRARVVQLLLIVAVVVGVGVDAFFAIVNFYPVAPHPSRGPKRYVVMQLDEISAAWFQANILDDFNDEADANLTVLRVDDEEQLQSAAADARKQGKDVVLVALPVTQLGRAVDTRLVQPFEGAIAGKQIAADFAGLGDKLLASGKLDGKQYFLPRMTVLDVAVFRVSKVRDAVLHWSVLRPQIDAALKRVNGHGLPDGYELSLSPDRWDAYDVFVMAYYWANRSYGGQPARPRIAHRVGDQIDGQQDIAASIYRFGGSDATFATTDSRAALDYFQWEALFRAEGLYPDKMYAADEPFDDEAVIDGLQKGDIFLAPIDALEAFKLHGGSHVGALPHVDDPGDLEFTALPSAASLALDPKGQPVRSNPSFSFREDWVWALAAGAGAPDIAYRFVSFVWRPEIHARECEGLGMLPLHPEVVAQRVSRFRLDWMSHVFDAGLLQAGRGEQVPAALVGKGLGSVYAQLWTKIVAGGVPPAPEDAIAEILRKPPAPKPLAIETAAAADGSAAATAPEPADDTAIVRASDELEDWETDAVIQMRDAGTGGHP